MGKIYIPTGYINNNYDYEYTNDYIVIHKYTNCYTQYQTTYCDCQRVYPTFDYNVSSNYSCSNSFTTSLDKTLITDETIYRLDYVYILILFLILAFIIVIVPYKIIKKLFGGRI